MSDVFREIGANPLQPGNGTLLLWLIRVTAHGVGFAAVACLIAALASLLGGGRYVYGELAGRRTTRRGHRGRPGLARISPLTIAGFTRNVR